MNNFLYKLIFLINWKKKLIPVIIQNFYKKNILMLAWLNKYCLIESFFLKKTCFWSRSKKIFWRKGYNSLYIQNIKNIFFDCDLDTILIKIDFLNYSCHYNIISCFNYSL